MVHRNPNELWYDNAARAVVESGTHEVSIRYFSNAPNSMYLCDKDGTIIREESLAQGTNVLSFSESLESGFLYMLVKKRCIVVERLTVDGVSVSVALLREIPFKFDPTNVRAKQEVKTEETVEETKTEEIKQVEPMENSSSRKSKRSKSH